MGFLRVLLALSVVIAHSSDIFGIRLVSPDTAVQSFYVISGFYMALILTKKYKGPKSYRLFLTNRFLRIYPTYWAILALAVALSLVSVFKGDVSSKVSEYKELLAHGGSAIPTFIWLIIGSIFLFFQDWFLFLKVDTLTHHISFITSFQITPGALYRFMFLPQAWTIGVELSFYLVAPFLVKMSNTFLGALLLLSVLARFIIYSMGFDHDPWTYRFFPLEVAMFIIGIFAYRYFESIENRHTKIDRFALPALIAVTCVYQFINFEITRYVFVLLTAFLTPFIFKHTRRNKLDTKIGELSYPIYMCHITVLVLIQKLSLPHLKPNGITVVIASLICAWLINYIICKPIDRYRENRVRSTLYRNNP